MLLSQITKRLVLFALCFPCIILGTDLVPAPAGEQAKVEQSIQLSQLETEAWLGLLDKGLYGESWNRASSIFRHTIKKDEWERAMDASRKPLGSLVSRSVLDIRTSKDPKGLPAGDYMVFFYKATFANAKEARELVTLFHEGDGQWRVLTYQVNR